MATPRPLKLVPLFFAADLPSDIRYELSELQISVHADSLEWFDGKTEQYLPMFKSWALNHDGDVRQWERFVLVGI